MKQNKGKVAIVAHHHEEEDEVMELARIVATHPVFRLTRATSRAEAGKPLCALYPFLRGFAAGDVRITEPDARDLAEACRLVFLAVPHGAAMPASVIFGIMSLPKS